MTATGKSYTTIEEFERIADLPENVDRLLELFHGEIIEKVPTPDHSVIAAIVAGFLHMYNKERHYSGLMTVEGRHQVGDDSALLPDVGFFKDRRISPGGSKFSTAPDLAVEIRSPGDTYKKMREKATHYLANGSQMVWLFFLEKKQIEVRLKNGDILVLGIDDTLTGGDVLPGFSVPVGEIFGQIPG